MRCRIVQPFRHLGVEHAIGDELEPGAVAELALREGWAVPGDAAGAAEPPERQAHEAAPQNKGEAPPARRRR